MFQLTKKQNIKDAEDLYYKWHDYEHEDIVDIDIPIPKGKLNNLGEVIRLDYTSPKWEKEDVYYYHNFKKNGPRLMIDNQENIFLNGNIKVTELGIDDWDDPQKFRKPRKPTKSVTKLGILELIMFIDPKTKKARSLTFGDRYYVADPKADWTFISSPMDIPVRNPTLRQELHNVLRKHRLPLDALQQDHPQHTKAIDLIKREGLYDRFKETGKAANPHPIIPLISYEGITLASTLAAGIAGGILGKELQNQIDKEYPLGKKNPESWAQQSNPKGNIYQWIYKKLIQVVPKGMIEQKTQSGKSKKPKGSGFMDLNYDYLREDKNGNPIIALSHYYKHPSGDMIPDPDMEVRVFLNRGLAEALTYQDLYGFRKVYYDGQIDVRAKKDLNKFLNQWLKNLILQDHKVVPPVNIPRSNPKKIIPYHKKYKQHSKPNPTDRHIMICRYLQLKQDKPGISKKEAIKQIANEFLDIGFDKKYWVKKISEVLSKEQLANPTLTIPIHSDEQIDHINKARKELSDAGISFDSGFGIDNSIVTQADWQLDWSLKGATLSGQSGMPISQMTLIDTHQQQFKSTKGHTIKYTWEIFFDGNDEFRIFRNGEHWWRSSDYHVNEADERWEHITKRKGKVKKWHERTEKEMKKKRSNPKRPNLTKMIMSDKATGTKLEWEKPNSYVIYGLPHKKPDGSTTYFYKSPIYIDVIKARKAFRRKVREFRKELGLKKSNPKKYPIPGYKTLTEREKEIIDEHRNEFIKYAQDDIDALEYNIKDMLKEAWITIEEANEKRKELQEELDIAWKEKIKRLLIEREIEEDL